MDFKKELHKYLKDTKIRKYKFAISLGVSNTTLHRYCENETPIPKSTKIAIMQITKNQIKFNLEE